MANEDQLARLKQGVEAWNDWREENPSIRINLINADLRSANLINADLINADLRSANLINADLRSANLINADLINANLSDADLINANLSYANLSYTNLININLGDAILSSANLRNADFINANLRSANLINANLINANLINADLINANLRNANLTAIQALNTNFEGTNLTGTCIQDWNINSKTNLNDVICESVYLNSDLEIRNGKLNRIYSDRRPRDRNFAPGEFSQLFAIVQDSLSFYFKNGIDWQAVAYSFQDIATNGTLLDIEGINTTKNDGVIITVNAPEDIDKGKVEEDFWKGYEVARQAFEEERKKVDRLFASPEEQNVRYEGEINRLLAMLDNTRAIAIHNGDRIENGQIGST
ncbi:MAG: pentapeptide repeat-containing protein [Cyanobacteria bacterium SBLK]|nr:pentapeptide repeat-containing protein [Cyanobacteria bacterium SBLK]